MTKPLTETGGKTLFAALSEPFVVAVPTQQYTIPELVGLTGRYIRIRPSNTSGDGYLTISQIQVIDTDNNNAALNKMVKATSSGGSPVDQKYGEAVLYDGVYILKPGRGNDPSCITDGTIIPRFGLTNVFETSVVNQNPSQPQLEDKQYVEIDLSANIIIKKVIYTGRQDSQDRTIESMEGLYDTLTQVGRLTNMRLEILDSGKNIVYATTFSDDPVKHETVINITASLFTINSGSGSWSALQTTSVPNPAYYKAIKDIFTTVSTSGSGSDTAIPSTDILNNHKSLIKAVNKLYESLNTAQTSTTLQRTFDISGGIFSTLLYESPLNFYNEVYIAAGCPGGKIECMPNANMVPAIPAVAAATAASLNTAVSNAIAVPPSIPQNLTVSVFGTASDAALAEMQESINICSSIFLGSPSLIEYYIRIKYETTAYTYKEVANMLKPSATHGTAYIRTRSNFAASPAGAASGGNNKWCMPDMIQVFHDGTFDTGISTQDQTWNAANCTRVLDPTTLALIPFASRNFIVQWIQNRTGRYMSYMNVKNNKTITDALSEATKQNKIFPTNVVIKATFDNITAAQTSFNNQQEPFIPLAVTPLKIPIYMDITSIGLLNSIAQQFYEMLGGQFSMSYVYDIFPLGSTMIDVRFDLVIHTDPDISYGPLLALKNQYFGFIQGKAITQDMADQAGYDYQLNTVIKEQEHIGNTLQTFHGAVARLFYTPVPSADGGSGATGAINITGMMFDVNAATSFIKQLNGGMEVPLGSMPGNINYSPTITYTKNVPQETINCSDSGTIRRIMTDYMNLVQGDKKILLTAANPVDTSKGTIMVNKVVGSTQVSPTQCVIQWNETLYDPTTNAPLTLSGDPSNWVANTCGLTTVSRYGLFSYIADYTSWYSPNYRFDASGLRLLTPISTTGAGSSAVTTILPACKFDAVTYSNSVGNRFAALGSTASAITTITNDFLQSAFKDGKGPVCSQTIPNYLFSATDYVAANPGITQANAMTDFKTKVATGTSPVLRLPVTITPMATPIVYTKPLPSSTTLDNASGLCATTACDDIDVLYTLVEQYNSRPSLAGSIIRVTRAYTPNAGQCDIEAEVNYDSMIQDLVGVTAPDPVTNIPITTYPMIKKGTVKYSTDGDNKLTEEIQDMTISGIQTVNIALTVALDKPSCSYMLVDAGAAGSGYSIQANTPRLYKPLNYITELANRGSAATGSSVAAIQSNYTTTGSSARTALTAYRANTYAAQGSIMQSLTTCPGAKCSDTSVMNNIINFFSGQVAGVTITQINKIGSLDGKSCDATYTTNNGQTLGGRFQMSIGAGGGCVPSTYVSIQPTPTYSDVQNMAVPLSTANTVASGFTDYAGPKATGVAVNFVNPGLESKEYVTARDEAYPMKSRGFGRDRARNSGVATTIREAQFELPLVQKVPLDAGASGATNYKYVRFRPLKTRSPTADAVHIGKFTFYLGDNAVLFEGKVSNPMGTWEGALTDVVGAGLRAGFYDTHKKPLVFAFKTPIALDGYSFTTATPGKSIGNDPIAWKVEGSTTGTFWTVLDEQARYPTPIERYKEIEIQRFNATA